MSSLEKLIFMYEMLMDLQERELDILARDQMALESYKSKKKANQLVVDATQVKLNERFDIMSNQQVLIKQFPALVELSVKEAEAKKDFKIRELEDLITKMGKLEITLIQDKLAKRKTN